MVVIARDTIMLDLGEEKQTNNNQTYNVDPIEPIRLDQLHALLRKALPPRRGGRYSREVITQRPTTDARPHLNEVMKRKEALHKRNRSMSA